MVLKDNSINLVEKINDQAVTTSVMVAETFGKRHDHVLRDIESIKKDVPNFGEMFIGGQSKDSYGRERKVYYMNKDGFTLLVMGYTGKKAMQFKLDYIEQFNAMERAIEKQHIQLPTTPQAMTKALLENMNANNEDIKTIKHDVDKLQNTMRINGNQEKALLDIHHKSAFKALGGKESNAYKNRKLRDKTFRSVWSEFKKAFYLPRYGELQQVRFDDGKEFLEAWQPNTELRLEIQKVNDQGTLF